MKGYLALALPVLNVVEAASPAEVDEPARLDEDACGGDDIGDGGLAGIVSDEPEGDGDVVGGVAEDDGEDAVETDEEVCAAVVVCVDVCLWAEGGVGGEGGGDVVVYAVAVGVGGGVGAQPEEGGRRHWRGKNSRIREGEHLSPSLIRLFFQVCETNLPIDLGRVSRRTGQTCHSRI